MLQIIFKKIYIYISSSFKFQLFYQSLNKFSQNSKSHKLLHFPQFSQCRLVHEMSTDLLDEAVMQFHVIYRHLYPIYGSPSSSSQYINNYLI